MIKITFTLGRFRIIKRFSFDSFLLFKFYFFVKGITLYERTTGYGSLTIYAELWSINLSSFIVWRASWLMLLFRLFMSLFHHAAAICSVRLNIHFSSSLYLCALFALNAPHSFGWISPTVIDLYVKDGSTFWPGKRELGIYLFSLKVLLGSLMRL